jgi:hypothetical protein
MQAAKQADEIETAALAHRAFHQCEARRLLLLAAYARQNLSIGETVALERLSERHRILAVS